MSDPPDRPPIYAIPLRRALRELCGDPMLIGAMRHDPVEEAFGTDWFKRYLGYCAKKTLARLRNDELNSWGQPSWSQSEPRVLSWRLWRRLEVLDEEFGVVGTGDRLVVYHDVVIAEKWWGGVKKRRGRPLKEDAPVLDEMARRLDADPTLSERDHRAIVGRLIDEGLVDLAGADRESVIRRLVAGFRCRKFGA